MEPPRGLRRRPAPVRLVERLPRPSAEEGVPRGSVLRSSLGVNGRVGGIEMPREGRRANDPLIAIYALMPSPGSGRQVTGGRDTLSLARPINAARSERLGAAGAQRVAESLRMDGCEITSVDLTGNEIGAEGVRFLASAFREIERKLAAQKLPASNPE